MFAVVIVNSFDADTPMCTFETEDEARAYLLYVWQKTYNTELAESIVGLNEKETYHEMDYARVEWNDGDYTEMIVTFDSKPDAEFEKNKQRYLEEVKNYV